ncbi:MAG: FkbM family methyltransferase [Deltaproteobacteria bacterium]|nr:FkbM family methyltransferase [Deltaproteobacteria bacterium]
METRRSYCTQSDSNYLTRGIALCESMQRHEKHPYVIYYVCLDEITRTVLEALRLPNVIPVPLHDVERGNEPLRVARGNRSLVEYYWTLTATILDWVMEQHPQIHTLTYLDADLYFYSSPDPVFEELKQGSVAIHEHRFSPELAHLAVENGRFNVGLMSFRRDSNGMAALRWWRDRCLEWCYAKPEDGKLGDQKYLEQFQTRFSGVVVLQHLGIALAPWNQSQFTIQSSPGTTPTINGQPLVFFHFHALAVPDPDVVIAAKHAYVVGESVVRACYVPYCEALDRAAARIRGVAPSSSFGMHEPVPVRAEHALIVKQGALGAKPGLAPIATQRRRVSMGAWDAYFPDPAARPVHTEQAHDTQGSGDELLLSLHGLLITRKVETLVFAGAHLFQEASLLFTLLPKLKRVYLFEPLPQLFAKLKQWEVRDPRVRVFPYALSDGDGQATFHVTNNDAQSSSLLPLAKHTEIFPEVVEVEKITVERKTLASVMAFHDLAPPDMLFIDTQGAEYQILSSLSQDLLRGVSLIYTEVSTEELYAGGRTLDDIKALLAPEFVFVAFAPLFPHTPTHGNALFVNQNATWLLKQG